MEAEKLVDNIVEIAKNAVPKIPRKWANIQVMSIKTPKSVALPVYNKTPEALNELAKLSGLEKEISEEEKGAKSEPKTEETTASISTANKGKPWGPKAVE